MKHVNLFLSDTLTASSYKSRGLRITHKYPERPNPVEHGQRLLREYAAAKTAHPGYSQEQVAAIKAKDGHYFDISGLKGKEMVVASLEAVPSGIRICNVKRNGEKDEAETIVTLYVPNSKEHVFLRKIDEYAKGVVEGKQKPAHNDLVRSIEKIEASVVKSLWTDSDDLFPGGVPVWCEVWLRVQKENQDEVRNTFLSLCEQLSIKVKEEYLNFPDRVVCIVLASEGNLAELLYSNENLAEFRRVVELSSFFTGLEPHEQRAFADDLVDRTTIESSDVAVCILDTGVNDTHPLLKDLYEIDSLHKARDYMISTNDMDGHGTQMAGIAGYGNLKQRLESQDDIVVRHSLESVKILGSQANEPELYGDYTMQAVSLAEISHPTKKRVVCLPITAPSTAEKSDGRPSSWSAAIDSLASGANDSVKRLILISAGNVQLDECNSLGYPNANIMHAIEDPAQSWNALSIGACTDMANIGSPSHKGFSPVARVGALSPYSSTSRLWRSKWPHKPEILCEGGNAAVNIIDGIHDSCDDLSVLTTYYQHTQRLFTTTNATSAAVANASWMAAQLMVQYPDCWPETIRALLVASARWTDSMMAKFCSDASKKRNVQDLLRTCGYGIANLERAQYCAENAVNMIIEAELQPFQKNASGYCGFAEMHLHELPWPKEYLLDMGSADVELKVVLSYFIEPGPGEIGFKDKYRYPSCGLRFDVNGPNESKEQFERRTNQQMNEEADDNIDTIANDTSRWFVGTNGRTVGSLHCDIWKGTAADLSAASYFAVYPTTGWWRTRGYLKRQDSKVRYSLVATLSTPVVEAQLYTEIVNKIAIAIPGTR